MFASRLNLLVRHRASLGDLSIVLAAMLVLAFIAWEVDVFVTKDTVTIAERTFELDEVLLLGGVLAVGLLIYSARRLIEQRREVRRRAAAERYARELAYQDGLTGLPNRRQFDESLRVAIASPPGAGAIHAVFLMDLNGFKNINDVYGHAIGDEVLVVVAQRLLGAMRAGDLVARFGGDEFAILARHLIDAEAAANIAMRVIEALATPIATGDSHHQIGVGIGIARIPDDAATTDESLRKADVALYRAKSQHRSAFCFFEEAMDQMVRERDHLERELRAAIVAGTIGVSYQPQMDLRTHAIVGFEARPCWNHEEFGEIPVERLVSIAEEIGLIQELSDGLLREACGAAALWPARILLSINVFPPQLADADLKQRILRVLEESGLAPERLEIEIAESVLVRHLEAVQDVLGALREHGIKIALGHFGSGYSSLYHLRNFKLDKIKIDRAFVETINSNPESAEIVGALIGLGHGFGFTVSADGVGDLDQSVALLGGGCEQGQGALFAGAMSSEAITEFLAHQEASATPRLQLATCLE